jgi:hypothetical protein
MARVSDEIIARERALLARLLEAGAARPRKRTLRVRKVSESVERSWVSAGCFGEAIQWRLKAKKRRRKRKGDP